MLARLARLIGFILLGLACVLYCSSATAKKKTKTKRAKAPAVAQYYVPVTGLAVAGMEQFDRKFMNFLRQWGLPGGAIAVIKNNQLVYSRGFGWANKEEHQAVQPYSVFRIASVSKLFTAVTVLKLAELQQLNLDDKVFGILNDLQPLDGRPINPRIYDITVRNLLNMSSGWFSPGMGHNDPMFGPWSKRMATIFSGELPQSCENTVRWMMSMPIRTKPGSSFVYSNLDYCLLGLIINKVTGHPYGYQGYENFVRENILAPLNITTMRIGSTRLDMTLPNEVRYYGNQAPITSEELMNSAYLPYSNKEVLQKNFSDGGWVASAIDLAVFMHALANNQILSPSSIQTMTTKPYFYNPKKPDYFTMGMKVYNARNGASWVQTGSFTGTNAMVMHKPDGTTIAVIFNSRPSTYTFFTRFRPQLRALLFSSFN